MTERKHLKVVTRGISVDCPYQRKQVAASVCFMGQRSPLHPFCYGCPDGAAMEEKYKTRTFTRQVVTEEVPEGPCSRFRVKVSEKKHGVAYTYAILKGDEVVVDLMETVVPGTMLTERRHHGQMSEGELAELRKDAAKERARMRAGAQAPKVVQNRRTQMIGKEMQQLIDDRKKRDAEQPAQGGKVMSRYFGMVSATHAKDKPRTTVTVKPGGRPTISTSSRGWGVKKRVEEKPEAPVVESTASLIRSEASRLKTLKRRAP